jgi:hypothetical protein
MLVRAIRCRTSTPQTSHKKENRAIEARFQFVGVGAPTITFQRGTAASIGVADLGG